MVTFPSEFNFPFGNMEDHPTTDFSWGLTANAWPAEPSWQLQTPTQILFGQDNQANAVPEFPADRTNAVGNRLNLEQFLDNCRREIETLSRVKGLLEEIQRIRGEIELLRPRVDHVEATSYTLQQQAVGCSCGEGLVLVDMVTSTIDQIRHDMLRLNEFKLLRSLLAWREASCGEKFHRYLDLKQKFVSSQSRLLHCLVLVVCCEPLLPL